MALCLALLLEACAPLPAAPQAPSAGSQFSISALLALPLTDALLLGEQHDAAEHQDIHHHVTAALAARQRLAGVVLEMAEQGRSSRGLAPEATEDEVRHHLSWNEGAWNWARYGPAIMAAVRSGREVAGGNLPRSEMTQAMQQPALELRLGPAALDQQRNNIREGHCGLLPESQIGPMTRIQIARDLAMADAVRSLARPGQTVLLLAGSAHVERLTGVPAHLPENFHSISVRLQAGSDASVQGRFDQIWKTAALPPRDYCAEFKGRIRPMTPRP